MLLETLFLVFLVVIGALIIYRGAIHEFQILQKDYAADVDWPTLLSEQLPLVIRNVPASWLGGWTLGKTGNKTWPIFTKDDKGKRFKIPWNAYLMTEVGAPAHEALAELAGSVKLLATLHNWVYDGMSCMHWLPVRTPVPTLLLSEEPLRKTVAEWTVFVATDGAPVELWLAHEGAIPEHEETQVLPWTATTTTVPWIGDVKYIEIKLRPGNAIMIPKHWWCSVRPAIQPETKRDGAWMWRAEFHSPASQFVSLLRPLNPEK
jgi:hypothetical protein